MSTSKKTNNSRMGSDGNEHSRIGASSMTRWSNCPGSVRLSEGLTGTTSKYAEEGTRAHEAAAMVLEKNAWPNNIPIDMVEAVKVYIECIRKDQSGFLNKGHLEDIRLVEFTFDLSHIHPDLFGTADYVYYNSSTKLLRVYDYKHGKGIPVEVENNQQLKYYGLGALFEVSRLLGIHPEEIEVVIVQPRCAHTDGAVRRWRITPVELLVDFTYELTNAAYATDKPNAKFNPGEWCRFCPAAGICTEIKHKAQAMAKQDFAPDLPYQPQELSEVLAALPAIEAWAKGVREFAYKEMQAGNEIPGFKLVPKRASRVWDRPAGEIAETLVDIMGLSLEDIYEPAKLKTAPALEKLLDKEQKKTLGALYSSVSSGDTLAPDSDKRPETKRDAKADFAEV